MLGIIYIYNCYFIGSLQTGLFEGQAGSKDVAMWYQWGFTHPNGRDCIKTAAQKKMPGGAVGEMSSHIVSLVAGGLRT